MEELIYKQVAEEFNIPVQAARLCFQSYMIYIREKMKEFDIYRDDIQESDFDNARLCFSLPQIGKIYCSYDRYLKVKKMYEIGKLKKCQNEIKDD